MIIIKNKIGKNGLWLVLLMNEVEQDRHVNKHFISAKWTTIEKEAEIKKKSQTTNINWVGQNVRSVIK